MATRRFVVVGQNSSPADFEDYVYLQLQKREPLRLIATEDRDELARRRSSAPQQEFTFIIRSIHTHTDTSLDFLDADDKFGHWIRINSDDEVSFTLFDE